MALKHALDDTICAIATPVGEGGIGIVRVSGPQAIDLVAPLVKLRSGRTFHSVDSHRLYPADIVAASRSKTENSEPPQAASVADIQDVLDEALVVVMRKPRSFTAEDVVELHCHGGAVILQRVLEELVRIGARLADPGEFTKRAFLNGRIDLAQAEAVLETIRAKTEVGLKLAQRQLRGKVSEIVRALRNELVHVLVEIEAGIDFAEEDIRFMEYDEVETRARAIRRRIENMIRIGQAGQVLREGATVAIVGRPNVGKSSLLNALVHRERAIVTPIPGTTRDVLEEWVNLDGVPVRLLDTAGLRVTSDPVETEGIRRALAAREDADLVLAVLDGSEELTIDDTALLKGLAGRPHVIVISKNDLLPRLDEQMIAGVSDPGRFPVIQKVSAKTGQGLDELKASIRSSLVRPELEADESVLVANARHLDALRKARAGLERVLGCVAGQAPAELLSAELRAAADALGEITGEITADEILDVVFSQFCIGK
jgi:tRNA modification GTPase